MQAIIDLVDIGLRVQITVDLFSQNQNEINYCE
jgi:hypothetical protein